MLESFISLTEDCDRLRSGPAGQYLDSFAEYLDRSGYRPLSGRLRLHAAWHLTSWSQWRDFSTISVRAAALARKAVEAAPLDRGHVCSSDSSEDVALCLNKRMTPHVHQHSYRPSATGW
jgi:hypothetical protein